MNYKLLYTKLINYCMETKPVDRLKCRNPHDYRLSHDSIYTENHHIIPKHDGGGNESSNLVALLPEEHYMAHLILYKANKNRNDFLAVRYMINGFKNKTNISVCTNKTYAAYVSMIKSFKKQIGWHTENGVDNIRKSKVGKIVCKSILTGDIVQLDNTDSRIGTEFVHHSKGMMSCYLVSTNKPVYISCAEFRENRHLYDRKSMRDVTGENNPMYTKLTDDIRNDIFDYVLSNCVEDGYFVSGLLKSYVKERYNKSEVWLVNHIGSMETLVGIVNRERGTSIIYNKYRKSNAHKKSLSIVNIGKKRIVKN